MTERLPVETFDIPVSEIRRGYRSAIYFNRSKKVLEQISTVPCPNVTMQVFQKKDAILCGIDEAIAVLKTCAGRWSDLAKAEKLFDAYMTHKLLARKYQATKHFDRAADQLASMIWTEGLLDDLWVPSWDRLDVKALHDGDEISPWEPVMHIEGPLADIVHLESVYLGLLARRTKVATNVNRTVTAANGKPVLFFADRFDHYATQGGDGYAAHVGGATSVASDAMGAWWGDHGIGTMPHALIAAFDGDVVWASKAFSKVLPEVPLVALVDFNNDCVYDALACAKEFGDRLYAVRLDTSENMVDRSISHMSEYTADYAGGITWKSPGDYKPTGVNPHLVWNVREALDNGGYEHVKIIVSGGFGVDKITAFEADHVPVDSYAVGSSLLQGSFDFTADVVDPVSKAGRWYRENDRLEIVE